MKICEWGYQDCLNQGTEKCDLCFSDSFHYKQVKVPIKTNLAARQAKADKRMGSNFEFKNHEYNKKILQDASTRMTPNSGAGCIKGDQEINGIISVMEELKTKITKQANGSKTFTINKLWLEKLDREARAANKEFWYLKFSFHEDDENVYVISDQNIIMSFILTIIEERKTAIQAKLDLEVFKNQIRLLETKNIALKAEIDFLKSKIKQLKNKKETAV